MNDTIYRFSRLLVGIFLLAFVLLPKSLFASPDIPVGTYPYNLVLSGTNLYVVNIMSDDVSVINTTTNINIDTISVGVRPSSATLVGTDLYVNNNTSGTLSVIDTTTYTVTDTITVGDNPSFSTLVGTDLYVSNSNSNNVSVIDTTTNTVVDTITVGQAPMFSILVGTDLYVLNMSSVDVSVIDTTTNTLTDTVSVGSWPFTPFFATLVGTNLYIGSGSLTNVPVLDTTTNTIIDNITVGSCPTASTLVGTDLYVNNECDGTISVIDTTTNTVTDTISAGSSPHTSILVGTDLYVVDRFSTTVFVVDTTTNTVTDTVTVGNNPYHLISTGTHVYVANNNSNSVSVIDSTTKTIVIVSPPVLLNAEITDNTITLTYDKALDTGSYPAVTDFTVSVNNQNHGITNGGIIIIGSTVVLTLDTYVEAGDVIAIDYLVGDNPIQDILGYSGASLSSQNVTNNTPVAVPTVSTGLVSSFSQTVAVLQGDIVLTGGSNPTGRGIQYGTTNMYGSFSPSDSGSFSTGTFSEEITNLSCGTLYHYRAYATNIAGTGLGDDETFTTISCENGGGGGGGGGDPTPTIVNTSATNITKTSVTLGANITDDLGGPITSRGMFYILTSHLIDGSPDDFANLHTTALDTTPGEGEFTENISGLDCGVEYVYVGYASIEPGATNPLEGAHFGSAGISTFTTLPCSSSGGSTVILIPSTPVSLNNGNLSFTSSTGSGSQIVGCVGSNMYSPITGQKCPVSNINQPYQFTRSLRFGSVGEDVRKLQEFLNSNGTVVSASGPGSPGNEIKTFGKKTMLALTKYQKANNITPASGFFGLKTMKLVNQILLEGK